MAKKELTIALKAIDEASGVFKRFEANAKGVVERSALTRPMDLAPVRKVQRTQEEQLIRDEQATIVRRLRAGEQVAKQERARQIAEERIFGKQIAQVKGEAQLQETIRQGRRREAVELSFLKRTQGLLGRGSTFKETAELFMGGGAIIGASMALRAIADTAAKARELSEAFRDGSKNAGDITDELTAQLPIIGHAYRATKDIVEIITGEEAALKKVRNHIEAINVATQARVDMQKRAAEGTKSLQDTAEDSRRQVLIREDESGQTGLWFQRTDAIKKAGDEAQKAIDEINQRMLDGQKAVEEDFKKLQAEGKAIIGGAVDGKVSREQAVRIDEILAGMRADEQKKAELAIIAARELEEVEIAKQDAILAIQQDFADQSLRRQKELEDERAKMSAEAKAKELEAIRANAQKENEARAEQARIANEPLRINGRTISQIREESKRDLMRSEPARSASADESRFLVGLTSGAERYQQQSLRKQDESLRKQDEVTRLLTKLVEFASKNPLSGGFPIFN